MEPFENLTAKTHGFECFQYSNVRFLDPHCIHTVQSQNYLVVEWFSIQMTYVTDHSFTRF